MAISVYNPKFITSGGTKVLNTVDVKNFVWSHNRWALEAGTMKKFPDEVGRALLKHIEFLVEVKKDNFTKIKEEVEEKKFKCDQCDFETNTKIAFMSHFKTHEKSNEVDGAGIEDAKPDGNYSAPGRVPMNTEDGIPTGVGTQSNPINDKDGVGWYGDGLKSDTL